MELLGAWRRYDGGAEMAGYLLLRVRRAAVSGVLVAARAAG